jgi:hypothetical protein
MNPQLLEELFMEGPAVFEVKSPTVKSIELIEKENTLQRPADNGQQLRLSCGLPSEAEFQDGLVAAGLGLHVRPPPWKGFRDAAPSSPFANDTASSSESLKGLVEGHMKEGRNIGEGA